MTYAIDLSTLTAAQGFIIQGAAPSEATGLWVSEAGDVNGDGFDDVIVGTPYGSDGGSRAGEAYVIYGKAGLTRGLVDLANFTAADGFIIQGDESGDQLGQAVSSAGDVNGDGIDDLIVGAPNGDNSYNGYSDFDSGKAYIIYGKTGTSRGTLDLTNLVAADGFIIEGDSGEDFAGTAVSSAGDINDDGIYDLIIGASFGDNGGANAGEAYVIYGKSGTTRGTLNLENLIASDGFIIQGDAPGDLAGAAVSSAGDVNGDGIDDVIIGAPFGDDGGEFAGEAYVIYGKTGASRSTVDLTNLAAGDGFAIQGDTAGDFAGISVSSAGDVNDDGIDDLMIGASNGDDGGANAGEAYVIYGKTGSSRSTLDLTNLSAADGFIIQGDTTGDVAGGSVSSAGDVNGDGVDDLIIGARYSSFDGQDFAGKAYVIYGKVGTSRGTLDLTNLAAGDGFVIHGDAASDYAGRSVSSAGDMNGDGFDDLLVGAPFGGTGTNNLGAGYIIYGFSRIAGAATADRLTGTLLRDTILGLEGRDNLSGRAGNDVLSGGAGLDRLKGGTGADTFEFSSMLDMTANVRTTDVILDFKRAQQDKIDLSIIDASSALSGANDTFTFDGMRRFGTSTEGDIYFQRFDLKGKVKDYTLVYIDTDGDRAAEGVIKVMGLHNFTAGDFIL